MEKLAIGLISAADTQSLNDHANLSKTRRTVVCQIQTRVFQACLKNRKNTGSHLPNDDFQ